MYTSVGCKVVVNFTLEHAFNVKEFHHLILNVHMYSDRTGLPLYGVISYHIQCIVDLRYV